MDTQTLFILTNLIPLIFIIIFIVDGWIKGALFMLVSILRLVVSYYLAQLVARFFTNTIMSFPAVRSQISAVALNHDQILSNLPGASILLNGGFLNITIENIAWWIVYAISFSILFFLIMLFFMILLKMTRFANEIPVLGYVNRILGAVEGLIFGTALALLVIYVLAFVLNLFGYQMISQALLSSWLPLTFVRLIS